MAYISKYWKQAEKAYRQAGQNRPDAQTDGTMLEAISPIWLVGLGNHSSLSLLQATRCRPAGTVLVYYMLWRTVNGGQKI